MEQERNIKSGKLELLIDGVRYYIMVSIALEFFYLLDSIIICLQNTVKLLSTTGFG